ncbi:diguanylate cyclase [Salmonella enterica subsp. enterica serovar Choleraesuis]|nr:diguanylate cyclase [Salmonella enterica subsp. enterica serovar Choleraesuis]
MASPATRQMDVSFRLLPGLVVTAIACYLLAFYSIQLTVDGHTLAPLWFPTSVMTIMFYHCPVPRWPVIALAGGGAILLACITLVPASLENLWLTLINIVEAAIAALLLRRLIPRENPLSSLGQWLRMVWSCAIIAPLCGSLLMFALTDQTFDWSLLSIWLLSESIPALALIPVGILYRRNYFSTPGNGIIVAESIFTLICTVALSIMALLWMPWPFAFIIVLLMWSAIRLPRLAAFLVFLTTLIVISTLMTTRPTLTAFPDPRQLDNTSWLPFLLVLLPANVMSIIMYAFRSDKKRILDSEIRFRSAMEYSAIGMALVSTEGRWMQVNRALCQFLDYPQERLQQLTFQEITWPEDLDADLAQFVRLQRDEIQSFSMEKRYITSHGNVVWGRMSASVVRYQDRSPNYYIAQIEDITELKLSERTNQRLMERITLANEAGGIGIWEWDLKTDRLSWDKRMFELYELPWSERPSYDQWRSRILSEDRAQVDSAINLALKTHSPLEVEFRIQLDNGIRHIHSLARRVKDASRDVDRLLGINMDMTEVKLLNEALFQEKERLHITLNSIGEAVICIDEQQRITFMNPVAEKLMGWSQDEALNQQLGDVAVITDGTNGPVIADISHFPHAFADDEQSAPDVVLHNRHGSSYDIHYSITPLMASSGLPQGSVIVIHDVSESRKMLRQLSYSASHDSLTGLANRTNFENVLKRLLATINGRHHSLMFIDLDRFKAVNDSAGHAAGDYLLREIASLMQHQVRPGDILARLGGDEFGLLLPDCEVQAAQTIGERIIQAINSYKLQWQGKGYTIGASIGLTSIDSNNRVASELLSQADIACYNSKHAGRGKVSLFDRKQAADAHDLPPLTARLQAITNASVTFSAWPVVYSSVPEAASFWLLEPRISGANVDTLAATSLYTLSDRQALEMARDERVISHFFDCYIQRIASRGLCAALPVSLATLSSPSASESLFTRINSLTLPSRLLHIVLYGDTPLTQPRVIENLRRLKAAGCVLIYNYASRDLDIFNALPRQTLDYLLLDSGLSGNIASNLMDEMMATIIHGHAQRLHIRTIAAAVHNGQTVDVLSAIGINMLYGEAIARQRPLDDLLNDILFGIH